MIIKLIRGSSDLKRDNMLEPIKNIYMGMPNGTNSGVTRYAGQDNVLGTLCSIRGQLVYYKENDNLEIFKSIAVDFKSRY